MRIIFTALLGLLIVACSNQTTAKKATSKQEVNVYTHRHYDTDKILLEAFEKETGIKVNVIKAKADELIEKMKIEGDQSPADILITSDAGRLYRAKSLGLLQTVNDSNIINVVPRHLKDEENQWFGITKRARVVVYAKDRVDSAQLSTYESLIQSDWKEKILVRSSSNIYNQSLLASIVAHHGEEVAANWAKMLVANMARNPKGNDRDQVKAIAAGEGDLAIVNTYYLGKLLNSSNEEEKKAGEAVGIFFPNQKDRGTHINISGMGLAKHSPNQANAIQLMNYLLSPNVQKAFAEANFEYPVRIDVEPSELLKSWGTFEEDLISLSELGANNQKAVMIFDKAGWR